MRERRGKDPSAKGTESRSGRLFRNSRHQVLRLPKDYELDAEEVDIERQGGSLIIAPKPRSWEVYFEQGQRLSEDFPASIEDLPPRQREAF